MSLWHAFYLRHHALTCINWYQFYCWCYHITIRWLLLFCSYIFNDSDRFICCVQEKHNTRWWSSTYMLCM